MNWNAPAIARAVGRFGAAAALGLQCLAVTGCDTAEVQASCPSFETLRAKLDQRIAGLEPGLPLEEFTNGFASQSLNFETPTSPEGAGFSVGLSEGNAAVYDSLACRFDETKKLISCHRECCSGEIRELTLAQYESLVIGESRDAVERRVCSPSSVHVQGAGRVTTSYYINLPVQFHPEGQSVILRYEQGKLISKETSVY